jgi:Effector-associated domain 4/NB-ARC domain
MDWGEQAENRVEKLLDVLLDYQNYSDERVKAKWKQKEGEVYCLEVLETTQENLAKLITQNENLYGHELKNEKEHVRRSIYCLQELEILIDHRPPNQKRGPKAKKLNFTLRFPSQDKKEIKNWLRREKWRWSDKSRSNKTVSPPIDNRDVSPLSPIETKRRVRKHLQEKILQLELEDIRLTLPSLELQQQINDLQERERTLSEQIKEDLKASSPLPRQRFLEFVGRKELLDRVIRTLEDPNDRPVIVIDGLGGIGKTAVTREVVNLTMERGSFYLTVWESAKPEEFSPGNTARVSTATIDFDNLLIQLGSKLGYFDVRSINDTDQKLLFLSKKLSEERYLIVIDNLETFSGYQAIVGRLEEVLQD